MTREKEIAVTTIIGSVFNFILTVAKLVAGVLGHSAAMIADGVHSLSDFISDFIILVFVKLSSKEKDEGHDYGHGKYETLAALLVSLILIVVAAKLIVNGVEGVMGIINGEAIPVPGKIALWAAAASIVIKEAMYQYTYRVGKKIDSKALIANAWHHRSDAFSSIASLLGIGGAILLGDKWVILDPLVCAGIGVAIVVIAVKIAMPSLREFLEASLPKETEDEIIAISEQVWGVLDVHELQTRSVGHSIIIDEHIVVNPDIKLSDAHDISTEIEKRLKARFGSDTQTHIHIEPSTEAE